MTKAKKETKSQVLNRLFEKYNLVKEDDVYDSRHFKIITRSGINKIEAQANIVFDFEIIPELTFTKLIEGDSERLTQEHTSEKGVRSVKITTKKPEPKYYTSVGIVAKATMCDDEGEVLGSVTTTGEANNDNVKQKPPYMMAMAEKRAKSRAVLMLTGFYAVGVFGEDESDDFKKEMNRRSRIKTEAPDPMSEAEILND